MATRVSAAPDLDAAFLAVDPGSTHSGLVEIGSRHDVLVHAHLENKALLDVLRQRRCAVVIEALQSHGNIMGSSMLDTAFWIGRMTQVLLDAHRNVYLLPRMEVRRQCANGQPINRVNDAWIRMYLQQRFGKDTLNGMNAHCVQAYALGVVFSDLADSFREQYRYGAS